MQVVESPQVQSHNKQVSEPIKVLTILDTRKFTLDSQTRLIQLT